MANVSHLHCDGCGDDGAVYLHGRCHMQSPTWAVLAGDVLTIECAECGKRIVRFIIQPFREEKDDLQK